MKVLGLFFSVLLFSLQGMAQEFQVKNTLNVFEVGDKHEAIFNAKGKEIDEINIFLKPVLVVKAEPKSESDYKLQIADVQNAQTPRDPALNVQVPFNVTNSECALPSVEALETALLSAANKKNIGHRYTPLP